jgi:hypothetical protein
MMVRRRRGRTGDGSRSRLGELDAGEPHLRVLDRIEAEDTEHGFTVLVVERVESP